MNDENPRPYDAPPGKRKRAPGAGRKPDPNKRIKTSITFDRLLYAALTKRLPGRSLSDKVETLLKTVPLVQMAIEAERLIQKEQEAMDDVRAYRVVTKAGEEFSGYHNRVSVVHTTYSDDGTQEVLEVEVPAWYASAYEQALNQERCVISYEAL